MLSQEKLSYRQKKKKRLEVTIIILFGKLNFLKLHWNEQEFLGKMHYTFLKFFEARTQRN